MFEAKNLRAWGLVVIFMALCGWYFWPQNPCTKQVKEAWQYFRPNRQFITPQASEEAEGMCLYSSVPGLLVPKHSMTPKSIRCASSSEHALAKELELWLEQGREGEYCSFATSLRVNDCQSCCVEGCENICSGACSAKKSKNPILRVYSSRGVTEQFCPGFAQSEADMMLHKYMYRSLLDLSSPEISVLEIPEKKEIACCNPSPSNPYHCLPAKPGQKNCIAFANNEETMYCGVRKDKKRTSLLRMEESISADTIFLSQQYYRWLHRNPQKSPLKNNTTQCVASTPFLHAYAEIDEVIDFQNYIDFVDRNPSYIVRSIYKKHLDPLLSSESNNICFRVNQKSPVGSIPTRRKRLETTLQMPILSKYNAQASLERPFINPFLLRFASEANQSDFFSSLYEDKSLGRSMQERMNKILRGLIQEEPQDTSVQEPVPYPLWKQIVSTNGYRLQKKGEENITLHRSFDTSTEYSLISFEKTSNSHEIYEKCYDNKEECVFTDVIVSKLDLEISRQDAIRNQEKSLIVLRAARDLNKEKQSCVRVLFSSFNRDSSAFMQLYSTVQIATEQISSGTVDSDFVQNSLIPKSIQKTSGGIYREDICDTPISISASYDSSFLDKVLPSLIPVLAKTSNLTITQTDRNPDVVLDFLPTFFLQEYPTFNHMYVDSNDVCQKVYQDCLEQLLIEGDTQCSFQGCSYPSKVNVNEIYQYALTEILSSRLYFPLFWLNINTVKIRNKTQLHHIP